jgi:phosphotriesterase-related protein
VDTTSIGIGRDPLALARISRATGLNIVMGGSHYVPLSYPADMDKRSEQSIADRIIRDITVGVGDTDVRQGIIGEVGNFWPMTDNQRKVLRASAHAQQATGAPISIHPGVHRDSPPQIVEVLVESGADPGHIIMGHLDSMNDNGLLKELMQAGCYLEWDLFAFEDTSFSDLAGQSYEPLNDVQRMEKIEFTIDQGFGHKIVIAHDVCTKRQYRRNGGKTYSHILENIVPRMRKRGFTEAQSHAILVDNPARVLAFK